MEIIKINLWKTNYPMWTSSPSRYLFYVNQIPSFSAVVLDLLSTFLQCLHENFHVFVGLNPHQLLRQVDLECHTWVHRGQRHTLFDSKKQQQGKKILFKNTQRLQFSNKIKSTNYIMIWWDLTVWEHLKESVYFRAVCLTKKQCFRCNATYRLWLWVWSELENRTVTSRQNESFCHCIMWHVGWLDIQSQEVMGVCAIKAAFESY